MTNPSNEAPINDVLASNLARMLRSQGLTQAALAQRAHLTTRTIANYLHPSLRAQGMGDKTPTAKLAEVQKLANALNLQTWQLLQPPVSDGIREN